MSNLQVSPSLESLAQTVNSPHLKQSPHKSQRCTYVHSTSSHTHNDSHNSENTDPNYSRNNAPQSSKNSRSNSIVDTHTTGLTQRKPQKSLLATDSVQFTPAEIKLQRARNLAFTRREQNKTKQLRDAALTREQVKSNNILYIVSLIWVIVIAVMLYVVLGAIYRGRTASGIGFTPIGSDNSFQSYKQRYANAGYSNPAGYGHYRN